MRSILNKHLAKKRVYLDYAAATPVRKEVVRAMAPYLSLQFGNASAVHTEGQIARDAIEASRATVAEILRIRKSEAYFTGGGTESNNLAIAGVLEALSKSGRIPDTCEVITTAIEHPSVLSVLKKYEAQGIVAHCVPVNGEGLIDLVAFKKLLSPKTVLVTFAYANSEIGVVQDVKAITRIARAHRVEAKSAYPYVHLDASQAPLYLPCAFDSLGVDLMTLDSGKFYGPKGAGVLAKKRAVAMAPVLSGGDQEEGLRPGTENAGAIVGFAEAFRIAQNSRELRIQKVRAVRDYAINLLLTEIDGAVLNGSCEERIANNINISIPGIDGEYAAVVLDHHGFAVSTKSACSGASGSGSHVIYELERGKNRSYTRVKSAGSRFHGSENPSRTTKCTMRGASDAGNNVAEDFKHAPGGDDARALGTLRITLGEETTKRNIDALVRVLARHVDMMRENIDRLAK